MDALAKFAQENRLHAMILMGRQYSSSVFVFQKDNQDTYQENLFNFLVAVLKAQVSNIVEKTIPYEHKYAKFFTTDKESYRQTSQRPTLMDEFKVKLANRGL